jgi:hypothetical protein
MTNFNWIELLPKDYNVLSLIKSKQFSQSEKETFKKWYWYPKKLAEEYNRKYDGYFMHSFDTSHKFIDFVKTGGPGEVCASTIDSEKPFTKSTIIVGGGKFRLLFDFDCYSQIDSYDNKYKRFATTEGTENDQLDVNDLKQKRKDERIKKALGGVEKIGDDYYDEGFVEINSPTTKLLFVTGTDKKGINQISKELNIPKVSFDKFSSLLKSGKLHEFLINFEKSLDIEDAEWSEEDYEKDIK